MTTFESSATDAAAALGAAGMRTLADRVATYWPHEAILAGMSDAQAEVTRPVLRCLDADGAAATEAAGFLRGVAAGYAAAAASVTVETVWSGPSSHAVPVRATAQVLTQLVAEATTELILTTYSAKPHEPLRDALAGAVARGVAVTIVIETLQGAGSALAGAEPAAAFAALDGVQLWHWPVDQRTESTSKMHAKLAVADRRALLVTSANLTQSGVQKNIEAGLLVRGGLAPTRVTEHIAELRTRGVLQPLSVSKHGEC